MKLPLSAIILTYNEEKNIQACLESVKDFVQDIFIVDSFSTDNTTDIVKKYTNNIYQNKFENHSKQWKWALENLPLRTEWVFAPDADQCITDELRASMKSFFSSIPENINGLYLNRKQIFLGRWIKHGGYYPKYLLKIFRKNKVYLSEKELVDHHFYISGKTMKLRGDLIEDNAKERDLIFWVNKHVNYACLLAKEELFEGKEEIQIEKRSPNWNACSAKNNYRKLPLFLRAFAYFLYRYFLQFGFLDGKEGLIFHFLQGCWFRFLVDAKIYEIKKSTLRENKSISGYVKDNYK